MLTQQCELKTASDKNCVQKYTEFFERTPKKFIKPDIKAFWNGLVKKSGMKKNSIIDKSDFGYVYFYDVINGKKTPSRDKIVKLILAMKLSLDDCQNALQYCGRSTLSPEIERDFILIYGIKEKLSVYEVSEVLASQQLLPL